MDNKELRQMSRELTGNPYFLSDVKSALYKRTQNDPVTAETARLARAGHVFIAHALNKSEKSFIVDIYKDFLQARQYELSNVISGLRLKGRIMLLSNA